MSRSAPPPLKKSLRRKGFLAQLGDLLAVDFLASNLLASGGRQAPGNSGPPRTRKLRLETLENRSMLTVFAYDDTYEVLHDQQLMSGSVLDNDSQSEMEQMIAALVSGPAQGTLSLSSSGNFTYTPPADFAGQVSFTYTASFGSESDQATATINVTNNAPTADDGNDSVVHDQTLVSTVDATDLDGDNLTYTLAAGPYQGTLNLTSTGSFTYTPGLHFVGVENFSFTAGDGIASDTATFTINVTNNAPEAWEGNDSILQDESLSSNVDASDNDGDNLTYTVASNPTHGTLSLNANGNFIYTPNAGFHGSDGFAFEATDGIAVDIAIFTISVAPPLPGTGSVSIDSVTQIEGSQWSSADPSHLAFAFTVSYSGSQTVAFNVSYNTFDITATSSGVSADYVANSGTLNFTGAPGQSQTIVVMVVADQVVELEETFGLQLESASTPLVTVGEQGYGTIANDDRAYVELKYLDGEDGYGIEGNPDTNELIRYRVELIGDVDVPVSVQFSLDLGTAESDDLSLLDLGTFTLSHYVPYMARNVLLHEDTNVEPDETFWADIALLETTGRAVELSPNNRLSGTIVDDDALKVQILDLTQDEGTGPGSAEFNVQVKLSGKVEGGVDVDVQTFDWTAVAGSDFAATSSTIHFMASETEKFFTVPVFRDSGREANEKFHAKVMDVRGTFNIPLDSAMLNPNSGLPDVHYYPWALVQIRNDDEGVFGSGSGRVAFYHGGDPGGTGLASGAHFHAAAEFYYDVTFNVSSFLDLVTALEDYVRTNGRVNEIAIFDHGDSVAGQEVGNDDIGQVLFGISDWEILAPLLNDDAFVWLFGCEVALNPTYCNFAADDVGPGATVRAANACVRYPVGGSVYLDAPGTWLDFDGLDGGYHP